jgi:hypothetical protein
MWSPSKRTDRVLDELVMNIATGQLDDVTAIAAALERGTAPRT